MGIIRTDTDYAIRALLQLAAESGAMVSCDSLAGQCDIPRSFAHKILKKMAKAGIVASRSGRAGGFRLIKDPAQISLLDVMQAVQGPPSVRRCVIAPATCPRSEKCPLSAQWRRLQGNIVDFLQRTTLHDLLTAAK